MHVTVFPYDYPTGVCGLLRCKNVNNILCHMAENYSVSNILDLPSNVLRCVNFGLNVLRCREFTLPHCQKKLNTILNNLLRSKELLKL